MAHLLAVDLGLRTGVALFREGRLLRYRSHNFGTLARLKRGAYQEVRAADPLTALVVEGARNLARPWIRLAMKRNAHIYAIQATDWRPKLLPKRARQSGSDAKEAAIELARKIIDAHGAPRPTSLRHDAAEAICIGHWGCLQQNQGEQVTLD